MSKAFITIVLITISINSLFSQNIDEKIDKIIYNQIIADSLPGASVSILKGNKILLNKPYGMADMSYRIPITKKTVFNTGSVSKQFTVFAILLLEKEGKLSLNDDVRQYIPELHKFEQKITLEQLARHTSGYKSVNFLANMAGWRQRDLTTHKQMMALIYKQKTLEFLSNTKYKYSNTGTMLLAEVVSRISEVSFAQFMRENIFETLKMTNTFVRDEEAIIIENEAHCYFLEDLDNNDLRKGINGHASFGYTNVYSNASDLTKWLLEYNNPKSAYRDLFLKMDSPTSLNDGTIVEHAMGQFISSYRGTEHIQHTGGHRAFVTYLGRFPELDLSIAICSNIDEFNLFEAVHSIADLFITDTTQTITDSTELIRSKTVNLTQEELNAFNGYYWQENDHLSRTILTRNDTLVYSRSPSNESYYMPITKNKFQMLDVDEAITIEFKEDKMLFKSSSEVSEFKKYQPYYYPLKELQQFVGVYWSEELNESFELVIENESLVAKSPKKRTITFNSIMRDFFSSNRWFLNLAKFHRTENNSIKGFMASNVQVNNVWFEKLK